MLIDLMIINFKNINKVDNILFAKEIHKHIKGQQGLYEIIDLKAYLDLANISYALSSFTQNYTVPNSIRTSNPTYNEFLEELSSFSKHILANSLDALILTTNKKRSISDKLIAKIDNIMNDENDILQDFEPFLTKVKNTSKKYGIGTLQDFEKLHKLSLNMLDKGYLLNSITLLNEAVGLFCKEEFKKINPNIKDFIEEFEGHVRHRKNDPYNKKYQLYSLSDQSKNLYKLGTGFRGDFLFIKEKYPKDDEIKFNDKSEKITVRIKNYLLDLKDEDLYRQRVDLIDKINRLRNNLAHGNSSQRLVDVEADIKEVLNGFSLYFIPKKRVVKDLRKKYKTDIYCRLTPL